ncbi:MAG: hypothetical protein J3R72DRAFT_446383 [Linnemannia gamsii]|nr:MAG: hypothetical protein J3R72DRAFT_446383 [Linnemannia gamsii]
MNEKASLLDDKSTPPTLAPQSDAIPPTSSLQTPQKESSSSSSSSSPSFFSFLRDLMMFILVELSKVHFIIGLAALILWHISDPVFWSLLGLIRCHNPIASFFLIAQGADCWSSNDCFTQDTIGCCATLIMSSCAIMVTIDENWFLNRAFCGVVTLGSLVALGAAVSRYRLKKKKNCNQYLRRIDIFITSPFINTNFIVLVHFIVARRGVV